MAARGPAMISYTDCVLAIDPDTGKLVIIFSLPHDLYGYARRKPRCWWMAPIKGDAQLLVEANRNGFLYILDRNDGKFFRRFRSWKS
jgi:alcohol dehydrogenase (cytochrome c)